MGSRATGHILSSKPRLVLTACLAALAAGCATQGAATPPAATAQTTISPQATPQIASAQASPEPTSSGGMGWSSNYARHTSGGQPVEIGQWANFSYGTGRRAVACQARSNPEIEITQQPQNGSVSLRPALVLIRHSHSGLCEGRTVDGVEVVYTPRPDFHGTEIVRYQTRFGTGSVQAVSATITVE